jgi:hypothetical protein
MKGFRFRVSGFPLRTEEPQNFEGWYRSHAQAFAPRDALSFWLKSTEFLPSTFDIRFLGVSFSIKLDASPACGWAEH